MNEDRLKLVESAMRGCGESYGALVKDFTGFVYSLALRMTGDHHMAQDVCQETFLRAWLKLKTLTEPSAFPGWISTTARRTCLNALEKRHRRMELGEDEVVLGNLNPTLPESFDPSRRILEEAILRLPLRDREMVTLCYFDQLEPAEVARVLEIPPGTVRVYLHRARKRLFDILKGRENELLG